MSVIQKVVDTRLKVRYAETDAQRIVYHGEYVVWFECGRTDYCEAAGYPYAEMERDGIFIVVTEIRARYRAAARYGDTVTVRTRFGGLKGRRGCSFLYEVLLPGGRVSAEGETHHLFVNGAGKPVAASEKVRQFFEGLVSPPSGGG